MMDWKEVFKDYPRDMTIGAFIGMIECTRALTLFAENMEKEEFIATLKKTLKHLEKDLEEMKNEKGTI